MKKSNIAIFIILGVLAFLYISYAFTASNKLTSNFSNSTAWVEANSAAINDTINVAYSHLVCEFPVTTLDARHQNQLIVLGDENAKIYASAKVVNDTLYLKQNPIYEGDTYVHRPNGTLNHIPHPKYSTIADGKVNGAYPLQIKVGSKNLKSITVRSQGSISIPDNPIAKKNNEPIYDPEVHNIHFHEFDELDIHLTEGGRIEIFMHVNSLNLLTERFGGVLHFRGKVNRLNLVNPHGYIRNSNSINVDSAFVICSDEESIYSNGILRLNCSKYLKADLNDLMDIYYQGNPLIEKTETSYGRVVNNNSRPDIEEIINTRQREAHRIPNAEEQIEIQKRATLDSLKIYSYRDSIGNLKLDPTELIQ